MNCIIIDGDKAARKRLELLIKETKPLKMQLSCHTIAEAEAIIRNNKIDLNFMELDGVDLQSLDFMDHLSNERPGLIIVTENKKLAPEAFDVDADDFIVKPVTRARLTKALFKIMNRSDNQKRKDDGK